MSEVLIISELLTLFPMVQKSFLVLIYPDFLIYLGQRLLWDLRMFCLNMKIVMDCSH